MQANHINQEETAAGVVLRLAGDFDGAAALDVTKQLDALGSRPVVIDFSLVRHAQDLAVAILARSLKENVQLKGLPVHQERLLRYCGLASSLQKAAAIATN